MRPKRENKKVLNEYKLLRRQKFERE